MTILIVNKIYICIDKFISQEKPEITPPLLVTVKSRKPEMLRALLL